MTHAPTPTPAGSSPFAILDTTAWDATFRCPHCGDTCTVSLHTDEELDDRDACCTGPLTDEQEQALIEAIRHERDFNGWAYI